MKRTSIKPFHKSSSFIYSAYTLHANKNIRYAYAKFILNQQNINSKWQTVSLASKENVKNWTVQFHCILFYGKEARFSVYRDIIKLFFFWLVNFTTLNWHTETVTNCWEKMEKKIKTSQNGKANYYFVRYVIFHCSKWRCIVLWANSSHTSHFMEERKCQKIKVSREKKNGKIKHPTNSSSRNSNSNVQNIQRITQLFLWLLLVTTATTIVKS